MFPMTHEVGLGQMRSLEAAMSALAPVLVVSCLRHQSTDRDLGHEVSEICPTVTYPCMQGAY